MRNCSINVNTSPEVAIWLKEVQSSLVVMGLLGGFPYRHWGRGTLRGFLDQNNWQLLD